VQTFKSFVIHYICMMGKMNV